MPDPTNCSPTGEGWFTHAVGSGHLWPLLDGERAEQDLQSGAAAAASRLAATFQRMTWGLGYVPEQVWEDPNTPASPFGADPTSASIGFTNGKAAGSAAPLIWGQAQYLRLVLDIHDGTVSDQPSITRARYVSSGGPSDVPVTITSPGAGSTASGATTTVTGTTTPGATVVVTSGQPGSRRPTPRRWWPRPLIRRARSAPACRRRRAPMCSTVATTTGPRATGWAQETVTGAT